MSTQFTHRSKSTRLPITPDEHSAPLHDSKTGPMDVPFLLKRMLPKVKQRFQHVWSLTFPSPISTTDSAISIERGFQSKLAVSMLRSWCNVELQSLSSLSQSLIMYHSQFTKRERLVTGRGSFFGPRHRITS